MPSTIVLGAQWGDEGKGKIVDLLAEGADLVVRFQGGANAGHTLKVGDRTVVLHLIPSGILRPGALNVIGNGCVVDLEQLAEEIEELRASGADVTPDSLLVSSRAHLVTPAHRFIDQLNGGAIGTTGRGIGPTYADKARRTGIRLESLLDGSLASRLQALNDEYSHLVRKLYGAELDGVAEATAALETAAPRMAPFIGDSAAAIHTAHRKGDRILYEGAQGTHLDLDHGTYPFVTSSSTTIGGAYTGAGVYLPFERRVAVVKAYTTRVGNGPFSTELDGEAGRVLRERGGEYGATTGRPRRCGWLDLPLLERSFRVNGFTEIALTKLDCLANLSPIMVATEEDPKGQPNYREMPGWTEDLSTLDEYSALPGPCRAYVELIEQRLEAPVSIVSVGPGREQTIQRP